MLCRAASQHLRTMLKRGLRLGDWHKPWLARGLCHLREREPSDALSRGRVSVPFGLQGQCWGLALAAELGQVWEHGLCLRVL